jgi:hypothetical protein
MLGESDGLARDGRRGQRRLLQGQAFNGLAQGGGEVSLGPVTSRRAGQPGESLAAILSGPASGRAEEEASVTGHAGQGASSSRKGRRKGLATTNREQVRTIRQESTALIAAAAQSVQTARELLATSKQLIEESRLVIERYRSRGTLWQQGWSKHREPEP